VKYKAMKFCINKNSKGVTLIELIVAMGIFSIIITLVVSLLAISLRGYRKTIALQNVQDNARFLLDFMTKEIRQSKITTLNTNGFSSSLILERPGPIVGEIVTYNFTGTLITRADSSRSGAINSEEVTISGRFYITGVGSDGFQPKVTVSLKVQNIGTKAEEKSFINLQATLSQRILDI